MDSAALRTLLEQVQAGQVGIEQAAEQLGTAPFIDLGFAKVDTHRSLRKGFPEVILCQGKQPEHVASIFEQLANTNDQVLGTRATPEMYEKVRSLVPGAEYHELARCITAVRKPLAPRGGTVLVVSAGTSDLPVAEEAAVTATVMGNPIDRLYDVGVAGLHRLLAHIETLRAASILIVVAGMEGALPSVVGGLVSRPVIAVPTSVGYGASFNGLAALLGMLNSCSSGLTVVNIDNGFGAAYSATLINRLQEG